MIPSQLSIAGFESPFERALNPDNRWVRLARLLPWDDLIAIYRKHFPEKQTLRPDLSPRLVLGAIIIKHICDLDDRETVDQISENIYMQYFLGYSSFCDTAPFDPSLFVEFRKRLGLAQINALNERIAKLKQDIETKKEESKEDKDNDRSDDSILDDHSWDAYNEGTRLEACIEKYKQRYQVYPKYVLADKIYCTRTNRAYLKERNITLKAKPLGRPSKEALSNQVSPGERNPIEGKFGQAKVGYGLDRIKARLASTSESWVASIILLLNLVHLAEVALLWIKLRFIQKHYQRLNTRFLQPAFFTLKMTA